MNEERKMQELRTPPAGSRKGGHNVLRVDCMRPVPAAVVAAIASAFVGSGTLHRHAVRSQLEQWSGALELVKAFGDSSRLTSEITATIGLGTLPLRNMALLSAVQANVDRRDASAVPITTLQSADALSPAALTEAAKFMRYASAAYGSALMVVYGLIPAAPPVELEQLGSRRVSELVWDSSSAICYHTGCSPADLVRLETESLDVAGSAECLRHFVAIDRSGSGAVVLSLRGTASISDVLHDAVACAFMQGSSILPPRAAARP